MEIPHAFGIDLTEQSRHPPSDMKSHTFILLPLLMLTATAAEPVVKLAGIQAVYDDGAKEFDGFKTYNSEKGLGVTLIIRSADKPMVAFDDDKAALKIGGADAKCRFFGGDMAFSKDRLALKLEFTAESAVKTSADGTLKIQGEIPITLATGKEETRSEPFTVSNGTTVKFPAGKEGLPVLKIKSSGKPKWGDDPFEIEFNTDTKPEAFAGIRFYTKDGQPVESKRGSTSWMSFGGKGSGSVTYSFQAAQTDLILAVESWTGKEEKKIKVDLNAGLSKP
jgi:hypothetical protein